MPESWKKMLLRSAEDPDLLHDLCRYPDTKLGFATYLEEHQTPTERLLWRELRGGRLGAEFEPQVIVCGFIVDFFCEQHQVAVEVDGAIHRSHAAQDYDRNREDILKRNGIRVIRVRARDVHECIDLVVNNIRNLTLGIDRHNWTPIGKVRDF
jgi:very-short-patch-repair endonuclease